MRGLVRGMPLLILCVLLVGAGRPTSKRYVCAPCDMECDKLVFDKPGNCPNCGCSWWSKRRRSRV